MSIYSLDLRKRIVTGREEGSSAIKLAERFKVSVRTVYRYWDRYEQTGSFKPLQIGGYRRCVLKDHGEDLKRWIIKEPGLTLEELMERCRSQLGIEIKKSALATHLGKLGLSYKKNAARRRARTS